MVVINLCDITKTLPVAYASGIVIKLTSHGSKSSDKNKTS